MIEVNPLGLLTGAGFTAASVFTFNADPLFAPLALMLLTVGGTYIWFSIRRPQPPTGV